jgi:hypothetical protein
LSFPYTMFTLQTSFKPLLLGGGGVKTVVEVTVNSKKGSSLNSCPKYVQEFGLWTKQQAGKKGAATGGGAENRRNMANKLVGKRGGGTSTGNEEEIWPK